LRRRELAAFGITHAERMVQMEEPVTFLRQVSSEQRNAFTGRHFAETDLVLLPPLVQRPLPIWMVANSAKDAAPDAVEHVRRRVARPGAAGSPSR
jgi:alkanesulfonate monooxygenase SsuD/methylene tetrahydromethanopterin reductase-like flavin-dependent oxidoreductase (luciferase family)